MLYSKIKKALVGAFLLLFLEPGMDLAQGNDTAVNNLEPRSSQKRAQEDYSPFPQPDAGYVTDHAHLLSKEDEERIERWLWQIESRTKVETIVVTIYSIKDYPGTPNRNIEEFATALFNKYGIGNMPANDGVLLLIAVRDRKTRIELGAKYGHTRDADAQYIMNNVIVPKFRDADYPAGIKNGVKAIALEFANVRIGKNWTLIGLVIAIPILGLIAFSLFQNGKRGWGWVVVGLIFIIILAIIYILVQIKRYMPRTSSDSWSGGGLGGFGGGFSGGGGATGGW